MDDICSLSLWFGSSKKANYEGGVDRISALPDKILGHILSFLPTKNAVGTSVLARRWKYLFTLVTKLDFDEKLVFDRAIDPYQVARERASSRKQGIELISSFNEFVDRVMMFLRSPTITSFRLKCNIGSDCTNVNAWITSALLRGVKELDISTYENDNCVLPISLFTWETLVVLKFRGYLELAGPVNLPSLKFLQLSSIELDEDDDGETVKNLILGCPVLEDLVLLDGWKEVQVIDISSKSLKRLNMDFSQGFDCPFHRSEVILDLPNLVYFNYVDMLATHYSLENMNSIEEARIDILLDVENLMHVSGAFCTPFIEIANGLTAAKLLYLSGNCLQALAGEKYTLPTFYNLSRLELGWTRYLAWRLVLPDLLHSAPALETVKFEEGIMHRVCDDDYEDKTFWSRLRKTPSCVTSRLKLVWIDVFHGFDEELQMARYFLRNGKVLKMMVLGWFDIETKKEYTELNKLKKLGASKGCLVMLGRELVESMGLI